MARTVAHVSAEAAQALEVVSSTRTAYAEARAAYRAACARAHDAGANYNAIARAADVTPQTARQLVLRAQG